MEHITESRGWGQIILSILKFIGFVILSMIPLQIVMLLMTVEEKLTTVENILAGIIAFFVIMVLIMFLWKKYRKYAKEKIQSIGWRDIGIAILFYILTRFIAVIGTVLIDVVYGKDMTANDEALMNVSRDSETSIIYFLLFLLVLGLLGPIAEELTYRGIGKHLLFNKNTFWLPLIITSSVFGLMHTPTEIISFLLYGLMGVVFFLAYQRRKNIVDSMLVHILNNGVSAVFIFITYIITLIS